MLCKFAPQNIQTVSDCVSKTSALFFLFYFNRLFGFLVSQAIRAYIWRKYHAYVDIQALQISPLAGRVFFKGFRYHGHNETVLVNDGYITWRYWLRRVKQADCKPGQCAAGSVADLNGGSGGRRRASGGEQGQSNALQHLPCRILVQIRGLEWFIYNRSPAYDSIFASMVASEHPHQAASLQGSQSAAAMPNAAQTSQDQSHKSTPPSEEETSSASSACDDIGATIDSTIDCVSTPTSPKTASQRSDLKLGDDQNSELPDFLKILPISVDCDRGAIAMGNENTECILVARFSSAAGQVDARGSRPVDQYKQSIDFEFIHPVIQLRPNEGYRESQIAAATIYRKTNDEGIKIGNQNALIPTFQRRIQKIMTSLRIFTPLFMKSVQSVSSDTVKKERADPTSSAEVPGRNRWLGLTRYLDEEEGIVQQEKWKAVEYGKVETVVDCPSIAVSFFWDVPGKVPSVTGIRNAPPPEFKSDINGDIPPEWGLDIRVRGGDINYGPWTDRQRVDLQRFFFPSLYKDSVPAAALATGETRLSTVFKVFVEIEQQTTLRIPTREESKDWRWKGHTTSGSETNKKPKSKKQSTKTRKGEKAALNPDIRPFGWLDVTVATDSCISYSMDMFARTSGFHNTLELDLRSPEMSTSVNHGVLWRSRSQQIICDLSNPLEWNALRRWHFDVHSDGLDVFVLRDHIFLLADLINDWTSGPLGDFLTFVPIKYSMSLRFSDFKIYLNVNDSNIINHPSDVDDNTFIVIWGQRLTAHLGIPLTEFRPTSNKITFDVDAYHGGFQLRTPSWNTQHTFLDTPEIATLKDLRLNGSYNYFSSTSNNLTDTVLLNLYGLAPTIHLYGFLIRYFLKFKDNYFGEDLHFRTLEEYQAQINRGDASGIIAADEASHARLSNDLDVILSVSADNACAMLPSNLYSASQNIKIDIASILADLRFTNYYMDLEVSFSPLALSRAMPENPQTFTDASDSSTQVFIDGIDIFGHRLFGLPPAEPTYVCNWDFSIGSITGECSTDFLHGLVLGLRCISFCFEDAENALPPLFPLVIHDITFLRAKIESICIWLHVGHAAFLFSTERISVTYNDWAGCLFSERLHLVIPNLVLADVDSWTASRHRSRRQPDVITYAYVQTAVDFRMVKQKSRFNEDRQLQQDHVGLHDARTRRTTWLLLSSDAPTANILPDQRAKIKPAAMPVPPLPEPISNCDRTSVDRASMSSVTARSASSNKISTRHSSFLSLPTSRRSIQDTAVDSEELNGPSMRSAAQADVRPSIYASPRPSVLETKIDRKASLNISSRQPSFQKATAEFKAAHPGLPPSTVTFSSSYEVPYFPLHLIRPDMRDVPEFLSSIRHNIDGIQYSSTEPDLPQTTNDDAVHNNFIVDLSSGLRGYCAPQALHHLNELLYCVQPKGVVDVLDELQVNSMTEVISQERKIAQVGETTQIRFQVPRLHLRFGDSRNTSASNKDIECQSYDLSAIGLAVNAGYAVKAPDALHTVAIEQTSAHIMLEALKSSATGWQGGSLNDNATIHVTLNNLVLWIVNGQSITGDIQVREFEVLSVNRQVESLASHIKSSTIMMEKVVKGFQETSEDQNARVRFVVFSLMTSGGPLTDPAFLTSASYVLRSATSHPRTTDTWKMISRVRFIQQSLPEHMQHQLDEQSIRGSMSCPTTASKQVIESFNSWRPWDLSHVERSPLLQIVYGSSSEATGLSTSRLPAIKASATIASIRLVIDPGPNQNQFAVDTLFIGLALNQPLLNTLGDIMAPSSSAKSSIVEIVCVTTTIHLNWEVCELVEDALRHFQNTLGKPSGATIEPSALTSWWEDHSIHAIVATDLILVSLNTINLKAVSLSNGIKTSFILSDSGHGARTTVANILVHLDSITSELINQSKVLAVSKVRHPSIYANMERFPKGHGNNTSWKFAASCEELSVDIREDLPGLVETADLVLGDEIAYFKKLSKSFIFDDTRSYERIDTEHPHQVNKVRMALFVDGYKLNVALSPSLVYALSGQIARSFIRSNEHQEADMVVEFHMKEHAHAFLSRTDGVTQEISSLPLPAISGHLALRAMNEAKKSVTVYATIESIIFNASAVHGLVRTLNQSEIANLKSSMTRDIETVKIHYRNIFRPSDVEEILAKSQSPIDILYSVHIIVAGLSINAATPEKDGHSAQLHLDLGCLVLNASNKDSDSGEALMFAELDIAMPSINMVLERSNDSANHQCGDIALAISFKGTSKHNDLGELVRSYRVQSSSLEVNVYKETASMIVDVFGHLQDEFKNLNLSEEIKTFRRMRRLRAKPGFLPPDPSKKDISADDDMVSGSFFTSMYSLELCDIQISWIIGETVSISPGREAQDLVLSFTKIDLATRKENAARLMMENFQLQMVPTSQPKKDRSFNSALLPEVVFNVAYLSTSKDRRFAFQAAGKSLNLRLTSQFILPASDLQRSIGLASQELRRAVADWNASLPQGGSQATSLMGNKKLSSLLVDADFAGAVVYVQGKKVLDPGSIAVNVNHTGRVPHHGRYGQFTQEDASSNTTLRSPGIALKVEYKDPGSDDPSLNAEIKVKASSNTLYPTVVPLILEISSSVKEIVGEPDEAQQPLESKFSQRKFLDEGTLTAADPNAILGSCRLNLGLRICRQDFSLSCQPMARVAATAQFDDIYITVNTVQSVDHSRFFAISATFTRLQASIQHDYSRDSTGNLEIESIVLSLMNSKHVSAAKGLSAILKISPMKAQINAKQLQDFLLFREIWIPIEMRHSSSNPAQMPGSEPQAFAVQRYQQVAAAGAFPWNATVSIAALDVQLDLGQALGKSAFIVTNFWVSSKKSSDWEQNLCLGFDKVGVDSTGRMSGFIELSKFRIRTSIQWPAREKAQNRTPLIQASIGFDHLRVKAAFDYQAFFITDVTSFEFLMYNVRDPRHASGDRLVGILDGDKVQAFCTTTSAAQGLALYQAFRRLIQEKQAAYDTSLKDIEKYLRRKSTTGPLLVRSTTKTEQPKHDPEVARTPIQLQTDVVVTIKAINIGAFPSTFFDNQIFKLEALNASARFAVVLEENRIHSSLGLTLGQLRIALSGVTRPNVPKRLEEVSVDEVVRFATSSRGGTILKVPKVVAIMQTWQTPESNHIDYIFKSSLEGKVDVGWNYSRISFIRGMLASHSRALAHRLGRPLLQSAVQITGGHQLEGYESERRPSEGGQEKITAVVHVPQSRYLYTALEPPIIETPQLRDMGEATPPLEWIGLNRDRLPNLTHQIVIVTLLEVAKEVEDAYARILGSS